MTLRISTWNIWFEDLELKARMRAILKELTEVDSDIVCIQEATEKILRTIETLLEQDKTLKMYDVVCEKRPFPSYGQAFLVSPSLQPISLTKETFSLKSRMGRKMMILRVGDLHIINVHLESVFSSSERHVKYSQLEDAISLCGLFKAAKAQTYPSDQRRKPSLSETAFQGTLIMGDFNMAPEDDLVFSKIVPKDFRVVSRGTITSDYKRNNNVRGPYESALDRILYRGPGKTKLLGRLGTSPKWVGMCFASDGQGSKEIFPSDHFGLTIDLTT
jgi:endonuclease/exonuclease/phosphatase family metal-dependent hydrolase